MGKLTYEEEKELAYKLQNGETEALDALVMHNQNLVKSIAAQYQGLGLEYDDLVQNGNVGLIKAARKYDPEKGVRFGTYAAHWIKQGIRRGLYREGTIRLPEYRKIQLLDCYHYCDGYANEHNGKQPSMEDICKRYKCDRKTAQWLKGGFTFLSLDKEYELMGMTLKDMLGTEEDYENLDSAILYELLEKEVGNLNAYIVWQRAVNEKGFGKIGEETGMSREAIRVRYDKSIKQIKDNKEIMDYLM